MPRKPVTDPHKVWNIAHHKRLEAYNKRIEQLLNRAITQAADLAMRHGAEATADHPFSYSDDKQLKAETEKLLKDLSKEITAVTKSAEGKEWDKAYQQATEYLSQVYKVAKQAEALQGLFDERLLGMKARNLEALNAFQQRKIGGLKLSDKVWDYTKDFEKQMEVSIDQALLEGKSAAELSRDIRSLLKDPDLLFRRVRGDNDQLRMSKAMEAFHPGTGKYRSAYANAMRLARSEINIAYRSSDTQTAQDFDACVGIEVHLSNNHNCKGVPDGEFYDICDELQGKYPKDFKFTGWHPQCRCYTTYILKTDEEFWRDLEDGVDRESVNTVKDVPDNFKEWLSDNEERIATAEERGTLPYFLRDNKVYWDKTYIPATPAKTAETPKLSVKERADIRHSQRTDAEEEAIRQEWAERKAIRNYGKRILNYMEGISDVDTSGLEKALRGGDVKLIEKEAKALKAIGKEILSLDKLDNPMQVAKATSMAEAKTINSAVTRTLSSMPTELAARKDKLKFEIDWVGREGKNRYPDTWKYSQDAYKKELAFVEHKLEIKSVADSVEDALAYSTTTRSKAFKTLADEMRGILTAKDFDIAAAKAKAAEVNAKIGRAHV